MIINGEGLKYDPLLLFTMKPQKFKKGEVIVTQKIRDYAECVLLSEDFTLGEDKFIPYVNWFHVDYKPRTKRIVKGIYENYDENGGGSITYGTNEGWHIANSWLTKIVQERIKQIDDNNDTGRNTQC